MDAPATFPPAAPTSGRFTPQQLRIAAIILGAVAALIIGYLFYRQWHGPSFLPAAYQVTVASDDLPLSAAYTFNTRSKEITPFLVEAQGTSVVIDAALDDTHGYYLIGAPGFKSSNLYRQERANAGRGLEALTNSDTLKFDLSYDERSGVVAYVVADGDARSVVVWDPNTKEEKDLGSGMRPTLLPGGFFVIIERDGKIVSVRVETGDVYEVLDLAEGAVFAVDAANMKVALYSPVIGKVQQFSIANSIGASYESNIAVTSAPEELLFSNGAPVAVTMDTGTGELVVTGGEKSVRIALPAALPEHYQLSIRHE